MTLIFSDGCIYYFAGGLPAPAPRLGGRVSPQTPTKTANCIWQMIYFRLFHGEQLRSRAMFKTKMIKGSLIQKISSAQLFEEENKAMGIRTIWQLCNHYPNPV
jgi:hypothetical protein